MDNPAIDNFLDLPKPSQTSTFSELKYIGKELALLGAKGIRRGSQRIWDGFWESPVQQRVARHMVILGIAATTAFILKPAAPQNIITYQNNQMPATEVSVPASASVAPPVFAPAEIQSLPASQENFAQQIFAGLNQEQKQKFQEEINKQFELYRNDEIRIKNTLRWESTLNLIVQDKRLGIPADQRDWWKKRMLEIIFVESEGNPKASSGIAHGLTQLKTSTAKESARRSGVLKFDIYNSWDNAFLGLEHQLNLAQRFGTLSLWAHHLGWGNMDLAVQTYLVKVVKMPVRDFDDQKLPEYINQYKITPFVLLKEPAVTAALKSVGAFEDKTEKYFAWLVAAGKAMGIEDLNQTQTRG
ncbi:transglycosylase SLT domain-containing protein [Candidatus Daviesbacteria bacterium]|nr:transglycosylase SLT domain-containing protein [Candidatus Daviesbacteria bacterium]